MSVTDTLNCQTERNRNVLQVHADQGVTDIKARIFCGDTFVPIDPDTVIEGLEHPYPEEWLQQVTIQKKKGAWFEKDSDKKRGFFDMLAEVGL